MTEPYPGDPQQWGPSQPPRQHPPQQPQFPHYPQQPHYPPAPFGYAPAPVVPLSPAVAVIAWIMLGVSLVTIIAANMTWASLGVLSVSGTDDGRDGWITLVLALIAGAVALASGLIRKQSGIHLAAGIVGLLCGLLIAAVALIDIVDIADSGVNVGGGLILTLLCGIALVGVGIAGIVKRR